MANFETPITGNFYIWKRYADSHASNNAVVPAIGCKMQRIEARAIGSRVSKCIPLICHE
jgi:hypothetical protein